MNSVLISILLGVAETNQSPWTECKNCWLTILFDGFCQSRSQRPRSFWSATVARSGWQSNADSGNEIGFLPFIVFVLRNCACANPRKLNRFLYLTIRRSQGLLVFQYGGGVAAGWQAAHNIFETESWWGVEKTTKKWGFVWRRNLR